MKIIILILLQTPIGTIKDIKSAFYADTLTYNPPQTLQQNATNSIMVIVFVITIMLFAGYWLYKSRLIRQKTEEFNISKEQISAMENKQHILCQHLLESSTIYLKIKELLRQNLQQINNEELLTSNDWNEISNIIEKQSPHFTQRLKNSFPNLKKEDIHFCYLVRIKLKYADIALLLGRTINMMYKRKNIIIKRMGINITECSFEDFIQKF